MSGLSLLIESTDSMIHIIAQTINTCQRYTCTCTTHPHNLCQCSLILRIDSANAQNISHHLHSAPQYNVAADHGKESKETNFFQQKHPNSDNSAPEMPHFNALRAHFSAVSQTQCWSTTPRSSRATTQSDTHGSHVQLPGFKVTPSYIALAL